MLPLLRESNANACAVPGPLRLLIAVNLLQAWRRLLALRHQSRLLTAVIGLFLVGYIALAFTLFYKGLHFAGTFPGLGAILIERMLFLLFAFLFGLLLLSNLIISYTNFFRNKETDFLMPLPVSSNAIVQWKFLESVVLASWAFLFLAAPLLAAFGMTQKVVWHFYPATMVMIGLFIVLPAVAGSWVAMNLARFLDRRLFQVTVLLLSVVAFVASVFWLRPERVTDEQLETRVLVVLDRLLQKTSFAQYPLLPSYWLSAGVQRWAEGALHAAGFFVMVLLSHCLFFGTFLLTRAGRTFSTATSMVQSRGSVFGRWEWFRRWQGARKRGALQTGWLERVLQSTFRLKPEVLALVVKDARVFWRDTTQWGQTAVLFGLLAAYIVNLRHFSQQLTSPFWISLVSFLNLGACSLNLATLTTRFVFPQFSLEGKRIWIVGMSPIGLRRIVWLKFLTASTASMVITQIMTLLSCHMLALEWDRVGFMVLSIGIMTLVLNGLAVGLGVLYPNFKEENPTKIVSGFGGTFCLVLSFVYIVGSVVLLAIGSPWGRYAQHHPGMVYLFQAGFIILSVLAGWLPLKLGLERTRHFEL
jgi:ABC-2 type transport system permease protein